MDSGFYAACTGLMARTEALETIANNLANVSTTGFRAIYEKAGMPLDSPGVRISRLEESITVLKGLFAEHLLRSQFSQFG